MQLRYSCVLHFTAVLLYSHMVHVKKSVIKNGVSTFIKKRVAQYYFLYPIISLSCIGIITTTQVLKELKMEHHSGNSYSEKTKGIFLSSNLQKGEVVTFLIYFVCIFLVSHLA